MIHFNCPSTSGSPFAEPLVFDWDEIAGTVSGPSAERILRIASDPMIAAHPWGRYHELSSEPLKSRVDMAAIVGIFHMLPPELINYYPKDDRDYPEVLKVKVFGPSGEFICDHELQIQY